MIAVRPPEYFPGLSYFALMDHVDRFVLADTFQYSRQSFQNRAKIRTPQRWQWITIPLNGGQHGRSINEVEIESSVHWMGKHWRALCYNYRTTPFFEFYEESFYSFLMMKWDTLGALTCASVEFIHGLLDLPTELIRASGLKSAPDSLSQILELVGDQTYWAPEEVIDYEMKRHPMLSVWHFESPTYRQNFDGFETGMSILDLLFNYGSETRSIIRHST